MHPVADLGAQQPQLPVFTESWLFWRFCPILACFGPSQTTRRHTARLQATKADTQDPQAAFGPLGMVCIGRTAPLG